MKEILRVDKLENGDCQIIKTYKGYRFVVATFHNYLGTSEESQDIGGTGKNIAQLYSEEYVKIIKKAIEVRESKKNKKL